MPPSASTLQPPRILPASRPQTPCARPAPAPWPCRPSSHTLTPAQFGARLNLSSSTIYRYIQSGWIPEHYVTWTGPRKIQIDPSAIDHLLATSRRRRSE